MIRRPRLGPLRAPNQRSDVLHVGTGVSNGHAAESAERRAGRDYEQSFRSRQAASTGEAAIIAAHTTPGPIAGLRVWQRPRFAVTRKTGTLAEEESAGRLGPVH